MDLDRDLQGWRPTTGMRDDLGNVVEDRVYNQMDMDRTLVLTKRTQRVAEKIVEYLLATDPYGKTIVFCEDINHAERMRSALVNVVGARYPAEKGHLSKFVVQITGDNDEGKGALDDFIHPERKYPVIATTSKLLTTGVDAKTCRLIVIDQRVESIIEFKQMIGRGTRIHEPTGKLWFTIMDFKKATERFADPDFDGEPLVVYEPDSGGTPVPPDPPEDIISDPPIEPEGRIRYVISGVEVLVVAERVQFYSSDGRLVTESLRDYTRDSVHATFASLDDFLRRWSSADRKKVVLDELAEHGVMFDQLREMLGRNLDPFDLVCHVAFDRPPLTRRERADAVKKRDVFTKYGETARAVLDALLAKYADEGVLPDDASVLRVSPFSQLGTPVELVKAFGGREGYLAAIRTLEGELYRDAG